MSIRQAVTKFVQLSTIAKHPAIRSVSTVVLYSDVSPLYQSVRCGASHASNSKGHKDANDKMKAARTSQCLRAMDLAFRQGGCEANPEINRKLLAAIKAGRDSQVPEATLQRALTRLAGYGNAKPSYIEARGPGNCCLVIETTSQNVRRFKSRLQYFMKRQGGTMISAKSMFAFEEKGIVEIGTEDQAEALTPDECEELAIECDCEEYYISTDNYGYPLIQLICDPKDRINVKTKVEEHLPANYVLHSFGVGFIPRTLHQVTPTDYKRLQLLIKEFQDDKEFSRLYHNIDMEALNALENEDSAAVAPS